MLVEVVDTSLRWLQTENKKNETGDAELSPLWFVGVLLYSFGAFCMALGVVLQKYSINKEERLNQHYSTSPRSKMKQPLWILGIITYGSSGGLLSAALAFAPQSLLTPLMSVVIVSNAILARFLLLEPLTRRDFYCICLIVVAVVATTSSAPTSESKKNTEELIELYKEVPFIIYLMVLLSTMFGFYYANRLLLKKKDRHEELTNKEEFMFSFSFGASAGCWGGLCVTMIKSALTIIEDKTTTEGFAQTFAEPLVYGLLAILVTCWYMQLNWINKGLERFPAVFIVSIEAVLNEIVAVLGGIIYFKEYEQFNVVRGMGFAFGLLLGVVGIVAFALRDNNVTSADDFFTQSNHCNCCKCCNLPPEYDSKHSRHLKSVAMSHGDIMYYDANGHPVQPQDGDHLVHEKINSPLGLIVDGAATAGKRALSRISFASANGSKRGSVFSRVSRVSRTSTYHANESVGGAAGAGVLTPVPRKVEKYKGRKDISQAEDDLYDYNNINQTTDTLLGIRKDDDDDDDLSDI